MREAQRSERPHMVAIRHGATWMAALALIIAAAAGLEASFTPAVHPSLIAIPGADEIVFHPIPDPEDQRVALLEGRVDIIPEPRHVFEFPADDTVSANDALSIISSSGFHLFHVGFNMREWPFSEPAVRRAFAHAINREAIVTSLFGDHHPTAVSYLPASYFPSGSPRSEPTLPEFDPVRVDELLGAGFERTADGILQDPRTGEPLRPLSLLAPTPEIGPQAYQAAQLIAEAATRAGIPLAVQPLTMEALEERLFRSEFHAYILGWLLPREPSALYALLHSSQDVKGGWNVFGIHHRELNRALDIVRAPSDAADAQTALEEVIDILAEEMPYIPLYSRPLTTLYRSDRIQGLVAIPGYGATGHRNVWTPLNIRPIGAHAAGSQRISWLLPEHPQTLHPLLADDEAAWHVLSRIYEPLWAPDPDTGEPIPWLAAAWEMDIWRDETGGSGTRLTFYLQEDIRWHDGQPFTAADVVFTLEYARENTLALSPPLKHIRAVHGPDEQTVVVEFDTENFWHFTRLNVPILPRHIWEEAGEGERVDPLANPLNPVQAVGRHRLVGTGPFRVGESLQDSTIRLVRQPDYWRTRLLELEK